MNKIIRVFKSKQEAVGIIEVILILVVIIGLVLIFKDQISDIITDAMKSITNDAGKILPKKG